MSGIQPSIFRITSQSWSIPILTVTLTKKVPVLRFQAKAINVKKNCLAFTIFRHHGKLGTQRWF